MKKNKEESIYENIVQRKDGKNIEISNKYIKQFGYPIKYIFEDTQNDKLKGEFNMVNISPLSPFIRNPKSDIGISSAVWIQHEMNEIEYKNINFYTVEHYERGYELASERGAENDITFDDIAKRTLAKELNFFEFDKINIKGSIIKLEDSYIYLFTITNFEKYMKNLIPKNIKDKNILTSGYQHYMKLKPWSRWHIDYYYKYIFVKS
jgi:hypothetical protein